ncbi:DNA ligase 1-like [Mercenaria mercenaria]|uniref:DNA ligase 1-like n=1 Tax=Mercenaria mercenaria TaxID=6596 RepID=UPI00234E98E0|nr:DNA ligase 1-like [Mercenaria mercenaria]
MTNKRANSQKQKQNQQRNAKKANVNKPPPTTYEQRGQSAKEKVHTDTMNSGSAKHKDNSRDMNPNAECFQINAALQNSMTTNYGQQTSDNATYITSNSLQQARETLYFQPLPYQPNRNDQTHSEMNQSPNQYYQMRPMQSNVSIDRVTMNDTTGAQNTNANMSQENQVNQNSATQNKTSDDTPQWVKTMMSEMNNQFKMIHFQFETQNQKWKSMEENMQRQNNKITNIEHKMQHFESLDSSVKSMKIQINSMDSSIKGNQKKVEEMEASVKFTDIICENINKNNESTQQDIEYLTKELHELKSEISNMNKKQYDQNEKILDIQTRSMSHNLIFMGIEEPALQEGEHETTEQTLTDFLDEHMGIKRYFDFHAVHRIGDKRQDQENPRPIIANFVNKKDKERVKYSGNVLKGKKFSVVEQFPKEIEDRRKKLYPVMRKAKEDKQNKVRLVKDRLYINNVQYEPTESDEIESRHQFDQNKAHVRKNWRNEERYSAPRQRIYEYDHYRGSKTYYQTKRKESTQNATPIPSFETPNRFGTLSFTNDSEWPPINVNREKKKATSPLDREILTKKQKENSEKSNSDSESEKSVIDVDSQDKNVPDHASGFLDHDSQGSKDEHNTNRNSTRTEEIDTRETQQRDSSDTTESLQNINGNQ